MLSSNLMTTITDSELRERLEHFSEMRDQGSLKDALGGVTDLIASARNDQLLANALILQASLFRLLGRTDEALRTLEKALYVARKMNKERAEILAAQSHLFFQIGKPQEAERLAFECLDITRKYGQTPEEEVNAAVCMGYLFQNRRDYQKALCWYKDALKICDKHELLKKKAMLLVDIGKVYGLMGQLTESISLLEEARNLLEPAGNSSQRIRNENALIFALYRLADPYRAIEDRIKAESYCRQALEKARPQGYKREEANSLYKIGLIEIANGNPDVALHHLSQSLKIYEEIKYIRQRIYCLIAIGDAYEQEGNHAAAIDKYYEAFGLLWDKAGEHIDGFIRVAKRISARYKKTDQETEANWLSRLADQLNTYSERSGVYEEHGRKEEIASLIVEIVDAVQTIQTENTYLCLALYANFNKGHRKILKNGTEILFTASEWEVFECLWKKNGEPCSIKELLVAIGQKPGEGPPTTRAVAAHIRKIREKIGRDPEYIRTHYGEGYSLRPPSSKDLH